MRLITVCLVLAFSAIPAFGATVYSLRDLGFLSGDQSYGSAINDQGQATGYARLFNGTYQAFFWDGSNMNPIDGSFGYDINNGGTIVGQRDSQAFSWNQVDGITLLDPANPGSANGLTNSDRAIGERGIGEATVFFSGGGATELYPNSRGAAINDAGQFVGRTPSSGYYSAGVNQPLQALSFNPFDLNNARQIVGRSFSNDQAVLLDFDTGVETAIGVLNPAVPFSIALGINEAGTVVGASGGELGFPASAFIWDSTLGIRDATQLLSSDYSDWTILTLDDINNRGQAIGVGLLNGLQHAVILTPIANVPEPASLLLVGLASVCGFGVVRSFRRRFHLTE